METDNKRPNAALVNREWYLAAKSVLNAAQLGQLLVKSVEYVLDGSNDVKYDTFVEMAFAMVKPALDSDIAKYLERCARNAANARSQSQRVAASGSEWEQIQLQHQLQLQTQHQLQLHLSLPISQKRKRDG